jgi:UDP-N-acetyl-D-mannosaminuronic acid dehydrogenase
MCPERTLEGDALRELNILPQIVGGIDGDSMRRAADLFSSLTKTLLEVRDPETAELIKLIDNTSRDVRFAFGNEVARICDGLGVNAYDVIHYGQLGYERTSVAYPGLVGGPCLEKDPHILQSSVADLGLELDIANAVRLVNERQPAETVESVLNAVGKSSGISVLVSGIAFKGRPETDDLRGSMGLRVFEQVCRDPRVGRVLVHDAVVSSDALAAVCPNAEVIDRLEPALASADLMLITNNHPFYSSPTFSDLLESSSKRPLVYDYWNNLRGSMAFQAIEGYTFLGNFKGFGNA